MPGLLSASGVALAECAVYLFVVKRIEPGCLAQELADTVTTWAHRRPLSRHVVVLAARESAWPLLLRISTGMSDTSGRNSDPKPGRRYWDRVRDTRSAEQDEVEDWMRGNAGSMAIAAVVAFLVVWFVLGQIGIL